MRIDNLFQGIRHTVSIYTFETIDKGYIILSGIRILLPFQINTSLILHEWIELAWLIYWQRAFRTMRKEGCYSPHRGALHNLCHLNIDIETTLEKCT